MKLHIEHPPVFSLISALARRSSDNSNSGRQQAEADPNKRKNIHKAKGGIKVPKTSSSFLTYEL